jgi:hypothetical protein
VHKPYLEDIVKLRFEDLQRTKAPNNIYIYIYVCLLVLVRLRSVLRLDRDLFPRFEGLKIKSWRPSDLVLRVLRD